MADAVGKKKASIEVSVWQRGKQIQKKRLRDRVDTKSRLAYYDRGPGPAGYLLPPLLGKKNHDQTYRIEPEFTMRPFLQSSFQMGGLVGPGTGSFKIPSDVTHHGKCYPLGQPFGLKRQENLEKYAAGPGSHNLPHPDVYLYRAGRCLVLPFRPLRNGTSTDSIYFHESMIGPNVVLRTSAQAVKMKGDWNQKKGVMDTGPGAGTYNIQEPERKPAWTMAGRTVASQYGKNSVGPKYSLENVKNGTRAPAWKLGQKANEFTGILRTACDAVDYKHMDQLR